MIETEPSLVVLFMQGNERAFEKVYSTYHKIIYTYAMKFTRSPEASEEITHDIFLKLWQFRENIDVSCNFRNLLFTISKNRLLNCQRHEKYVSSMEYQLSSGPVVSRNAGEDGILAEELQRAFEKAVSQLPPQCKLIFNMSRLENKSYDEIAREMYISRNTVRIQIIKSLKLLREKLNVVLK
jgi:RNA polymerase sigma-70 factor (ECF subfamily)